MIKIVIADDHAIVRAGLRALFGAESDIEIVAEADDGQSALAAAETHRPDVLLLDLSMPRSHGLEALARLHERVPSTKLLVLSMHAAPDFVRPALNSGASGYVVKGSGLDSLVQAVRSVAAGERFLCPQATRAASPDAALRSCPSPADPFDRLTPREREVLRLVAEGHSNREIGIILDVSPKTADAHRTNLMAKLDLHDSRALTRFAMRRGLVGDE